MWRGSWDCRLVRMVPMGITQSTGAGPVDVNHSPYADFSVASPGYFQTMGIPIKRGRDFSQQDTGESPFVAVISESLAKQSFGNADPLGKQIQCGLDSDKWMTVVGVVGDVRQGSPAENPGPTLYMPMTQHPFYANQIHIVLRTEVKPLTLMNAVHEDNCAGESVHRDALYHHGRHGEHVDRDGAFSRGR